jgi:hypothetical protein
VHAADGVTTAAYNVNVTVATSSAAAITSYSLNGIAGIISEGTVPKTISVTMPSGTDLTVAMTATYLTTGTSVTVAGVTQNSALPPTNVFTQGTPKIYTVHAADGVTTAAYNVNVTVAPTIPGPAGAAPNLGTAAPFGIIAYNAITNSAGASHIYGDVALTQPGPGGTIASVTGPGFNDAGIAGMLTSSGVTNSNGTHPGLITAADNGTAINKAALPQLLSDLGAAYADLKTRAAPAVLPVFPAGGGGGDFVAAAPDLSGWILTPGIYTTTGTYALSNTLGPLVLDAQNNPDAVFIIRSTGLGISGLTSTTGSVVLQGGAQSKNVYWLVDNLTVGGGTFFQGTVVAGHAITLLSFANVEGRMLAGSLGLVSGALTLTSTNIITVPK